MAEQLETEACQQAAQLHASVEQERGTWDQLCRRVLPAFSTDLTGMSSTITHPMHRVYTCAEQHLSAACVTQARAVMLLMPCTAC